MMPAAAWALAGLLAGLAPAGAARPFTTFTIVARDAASGDVGVATCSRALAAGAVVPWARAGVGAVAVQAWATSDLGPDLLARLSGGAAPHDALAAFLAQDSQPERRQLGVVSRAGVAASHTGRETLAYAGAIEEPDLLVLGNLVAGRQTLEAMAAAFHKTRDIPGATLAARLLAALEAGQAAGGDRRGERSAALLTDSLDREPAHGRRVNLRVDDHDEPVRELRRIYDASIETPGYRVLSRPEGRDVLALQRLLKQAGLLEREPDGVFDDATVEAVEAFRRTQGMSGAGLAGRAGLVDAELIARLREWIGRAERSQHSPGARDGPRP